MTSCSDCGVGPKVLSLVSQCRGGDAAADSPETHASAAVAPAKKLREAQTPLLSPVKVDTIEKGVRKNLAGRQVRVVCGDSMGMLLVGEALCFPMGSGPLGSVRCCGCSSGTECCMLSPVPQFILLQEGTQCEPAALSPPVTKEMHGLILLMLGWGSGRLFGGPLGVPSMWASLRLQSGMCCGNLSALTDAGEHSLPGAHPKRPFCTCR